MTTTNLPAVSEQMPKFKMPDDIKSVTDTQKGWLMLEHKKTWTFQSLQKDELSIQTNLQKLDELMKCKDEEVDKNLKLVQELLSTAKTSYDIMKEKRLNFTSMLKEKIIDPAMEFEKRSEVLIKAAGGKEFIMRERANTIQGYAERKNQEEADFLAHVKNEYVRIKESYKIALNNMIFEAYNTALNQKQDPKTIGDYIASIKKFMTEIKMPHFEKFNRTPWGGEEQEKKWKARAAELFKTIQPYNAKDDLQDALKKLDDQFAMYAQDLKRAKKAMEEAEEKRKQAEEKSKKEIQKEAAINTLEAEASSSTFVGSASGAKTAIKKKMAIVEEETEEFERSVISAMLKNWTEARKITKAAFGKLTVPQMVVALGNLATEKSWTSVTPNQVFSGLTLKVVKK